MVLRSNNEWVSACTLPERAILVRRGLLATTDGRLAPMVERQLFGSTDQTPSPWGGVVYLQPLKRIPALFSQPRHLEWDSFRVLQEHVVSSDQSPLNRNIDGIHFRSPSFTWDWELPLVLMSFLKAVGVCAIKPLTSHHIHSGQSWKSPTIFRCTIYLFVSSRLLVRCHHANWNTHITERRGHAKGHTCVLSLSVFIKMSKRDQLLVVDEDISTKDIRIPMTMEPARMLSFLNNQTWQGSNFPP